MARRDWSRIGEGRKRVKGICRDRDPWLFCDFGLELIEED